MTASRVGLPRTASEQFEARLLAEAAKLANQANRSYVTVDDVLEQRLIKEAGTRP